MPNSNDEEDDYDYGYSERDIPVQIQEDFMPPGITPFLSQEQAMARDAMLSQALPSSGSPSTGPIGAATREYLSGSPGLFIQGGPSVPAGTIMVNGQLERSQSAPQPIPWWITAADEFKEQRRQEDFLRSLVAQSGPAGAQAISRANRLQAQMNLQNDLRSGLPLRDALAKNPGVFEGAPAALARLATARTPVVKAPFAPTQTTLGGETYTQVSPNRFVRERKENQGLTKAQELSFLGQQSKIAAKQLEDATVAGNIRDIAAAKTELQSLKDQADELRGKKVTKVQQTQTSPRVALANRLSSEHPDWSKEKIIEEVKKQLK